MTLVSFLVWCQIASPEAVSVFVVLKANVSSELDYDCLELGAITCKISDTDRL